MKKVIKKVLFDWKHWVGWLISTGAIFGVFWLKIVQESPLWMMFLILISIIVIVDLIKHKIDLQ